MVKLPSTRLTEVGRTVAPAADEAGTSPTLVRRELASPGKVMRAGIKPRTATPPAVVAAEALEGSVVVAPKPPAQAPVASAHPRIYQVLPPIMRAGVRGLDTPLLAVLEAAVLEVGRGRGTARTARPTSAVAEVVVVPLVMDMAQAELAGQAS